MQTIYTAFGSKPGVLLGLLDLIDRSEVEPLAQRLMTAGAPRELLDLVATLERTVRESSGEIFELVRQGAATDPDVAKVYQAGLARHREGVARVCARLAAGGHLRKPLTEKTAIATALALTSMEAYDEVVHQRGWPHDDYEEWLAAALRRALTGRS